jgi:methyltransferase (TIGR00027 family)
MYTAISKTAFYCCGIRARDAASPHSLCADIYAPDFLAGGGWEVFQHFSRARHADRTNVVRSRVVQDELAARLKRDKNLQIVNIGAGFDSRAYRLAGGRWFEFDEPAVIAHKNACLPVDLCANPLRRIPVEFAKDELGDALRQCDPHADTVVVAEGVLMYLDVMQVNALISALREAFPTHTLVCDLMDETFFTRYMGSKLYRQIRELGTEFKLIEPNPERLFLDHGYVHDGEPISLVGRARELKVVTVPRFALQTVLRSLRDGYRMHTFRVRPAAGTA